MGRQVSRVGNGYSLLGTYLTPELRHKLTVVQRLHYRVLGAHWFLDNPGLARYYTSPVVDTR
jgi:hypothetical protein